jgi:uncharacterized membrane protein YeaQ/YmgE (transglycosylase-associated protein family)
MNIITWIILGLLAGVIAKSIYPGYQGGGMISTMILGIVGAFIGGTLFTLIRTGTLQLTSASLSIPGVVVAVIEAAEYNLTIVRMINCVFLGESLQELKLCFFTKKNQFMLSRLMKQIPVLLS